MKKEYFITERLFPDDDVTVVVKDKESGKFLAVATLRVYEHNEVLVKKFSMFKKFRKKGLAAETLKDLCEVLKTKYKNIYFDVEARNPYHTIFLHILLKIRCKITSFYHEARLTYVGKNLNLSQYRVDNNDCTFVKAVCDYDSFEDRFIKLNKEDDNE